MEFIERLDFVYEVGMFIVLYYRSFVEMNCVFWNSFCGLLLSFWVVDCDIVYCVFSSCNVYGYNFVGVSFVFVFYVEVIYSFFGMWRKLFLFFSDRIIGVECCGGKFFLLFVIIEKVFRGCNNFEVRIWEVWYCEKVLFMSV